MNAAEATLHAKAQRLGAPAYEKSPLDLPDHAADAVLIYDLKRDLIERGRYFVTEYVPVEYPIKPNPKPPWYAEIRPDGTLNHRAVAMERGRSELDVLLRAWLAAAKAEGWTR